MIIYTYSH